MSENNLDASEGHHMVTCIYTYICVCVDMYVYFALESMGNLGT